MFRSRSWFGGGWNKPKNRLSLDHLKYLCSILEKNTTVSENNRGLLVESLRSITEILIWGDQHDSSVFDFFLEKNMLSYFLRIMRQKSGGSSFVCVQLLQTLNILFENIRNETSLYYLLSNNHVNSIIVHKFDFSDEDVMGYYILFLKTLSLKLNAHTIHFFYNEHTNDFPLYTEAIKFFNHPESMVRIAVRTISLNVYRVQNNSMLRFIRDKTAAPYFSNLVWFIGKHILELDGCVRTDIDHQSNHKLSNLVAEHLDHLHYLNDILLLEIKDLNAVLTEHLLHKLFVPLYVYSLQPVQLSYNNGAGTEIGHNLNIEIQEIYNPRVSSVVALYLLSLVFLVITHAPLVHGLAWVILNGDFNVFKEGASTILNTYVDNREVVIPSFAEPQESLAQALDTVAFNSANYIETEENLSGLLQRVDLTDHNIVVHSSADALDSQNLLSTVQLANITDEEKEQIQLQNNHPAQHDSSPVVLNNLTISKYTVQRPFLETVLSALDCLESDYRAFLGLCLIYAMSFNKGVENEWFHKVLSKHGNGSQSYKTQLIERLLNIVTMSTQPGCRIRLVTIDISLQLLLTLIKSKSSTTAKTILENQQSILFAAHNESMAVLRNFYKSEDIFLDLFEDEYNEMCKSQLNVEFICMDSAILLPPTGTPLTGIPFTRRLPCGEVEKARKAIRVFFLLRKICHDILNEKETMLPLTNNVNIIHVENVLDLNNSDLIGCTVISNDNTRQKLFLVIDSLQLILVEPDAKLLGWGVAKFVGFLQDVEVTGVKDDSRCLHITVHRGCATYNRSPLISAKFVFEDHIRCMAAKQRLTKGRSKARQKKMYQIAQMIDIPGQLSHLPTCLTVGLRSVNNFTSNVYGNNGQTNRDHRPIFSTATRVPGFAAALRRDNGMRGGISRIQIVENRTINNLRNETVGRSRKCSSNSRFAANLTNQNSTVNNEKQTRDKSISPNRNICLRENSQVRSSKESSPTISRPRAEEIPLEDLQHSNNGRNSRIASAVSSSSQTSSVIRTPDQTMINNCHLLNDTVLSQKPTMNHNTNIHARSSKETSFIATDTSSKRNGDIETV